MKSKSLTDELLLPFERPLNGYEIKDFLIYLMNVSKYRIKGEESKKWLLKRYIDLNPMDPVTSKEKLMKRVPMHKILRIDGTIANTEQPIIAKSFRILTGQFDGKEEVHYHGIQFEDKNISDLEEKFVDSVRESIKNYFSSTQ